MKFHREIAGTNLRLIRSYAPGRIVTSHETLLASAVIAPAAVIPDWPPRSAAELAMAHLDALLALEPEVVLLGTGARLSFPDRALLAALMARGIGVEVMDTAAACRTYNVLAGEGRRVVAGLIAIEP
jgi:uncharacterized protein